MGNHSHGKYGTFFPEVNDMDQVKIGKFIAMLRKEAELTQESLGEKLGVTNKTISRWENGIICRTSKCFKFWRKHSVSASMNCSQANG